MSVVYWKKVFILFISNVDGEYALKRYHIKKESTVHVSFTVYLLFLEGISKIIARRKLYCLKKKKREGDRKKKDKFSYNNWNLAVSVWIYIIHRKHSNKI